MKRLVTSLSLVVCLFMAGFASEIRLKGKLAEALPGSYLVLEQNKIFTFLHVHDRLDNKVIIEETSIPASSFAKYKMDWKSWFEAGAPGHTSWIMSKINLDTGLFEQAYSFTHRGWIDVSTSNPFLATLLNLRFHELPSSERRRIGQLQPFSKKDTRPLWNPRLIVNGQIVPNIPFSAYKARWPSDGSELSRKVIEIYLPQSNHEMTTWYPGYFPFWLEVDNAALNATVRVVDSGMEAHSPKPSCFQL